MQNKQIRFQLIAVIILSLALIRLMGLILSPNVPTVEKSEIVTVAAVIRQTEEVVEEKKLPQKPKAVKKIVAKPKKQVNELAPTTTFENAHDFIRKAAPIARKVGHKYDVPPAIILAQALVESRAGQSKLAVNNNNLFGHKCFSKTCTKGHCTNYTDDTHKDFFVVYKSMEESFKAHAQKLSSGRYKHLQRYGTNYRKWATGLKSAGYATDKNYASKLIKTVEKYNLNRYN